MKTKQNVSQTIEISSNWLLISFKCKKKKKIKNTAKNIICYFITTFLAKTFIAQTIETKTTFRLSLGFGEGEGEGRGHWSEGEHGKIKKSFKKM